MVCNKCGKIGLDQYDFYFQWHNQNNKYYYSVWCKECKKEDEKKWVNKNREYRNGYLKQHRQNNPEYYKKYIKQWREDNKINLKKCKKNIVKNIVKIIEAKYMLIMLNVEQLN